MKSPTLRKQPVRDKETMSEPKRWSAYVLASLLLCSSAAWGQKLKFGDQVIGEAIACAKKSYTDTGSKANHYIVEGSAETSCDTLGSAKAASGAVTGPPQVVAQVETAFGKDGAGYGVAQGVTHDTAVLTPPGGFKGTKVAVVIKTGYIYEIKDAKNEDASWYIGWYVNGKEIRKAQATSNGGGNVKINLHFSVPKVYSRFQFLLTIGITAGASTGAFAAANTTPSVDLVLPKGWRYTWLGKQAGYRHQEDQPQ
jgi:hypothetical protein